MRAASVVLALLLALATAADAAKAVDTTPPQATPRMGELLPPSMEAPTTPHRSGELDCQGCHQRKHQGVLRMYLGMGGRGTPMIPSHMFQVRVECVACHIAPKESEATAGFVGQTFRPTEQACVNCHGAKYGGMLDRWVTTLNRMRDVVAPKIAAARSALGPADAKNPKHAKARQLVDDADFNVRFVALGRGVHNVFYAADLLKLANGWVDEAFTLLGKPAPKTDDMLVRGGYCAVLCHEQAGVKQPQTVGFGKRRVPHVRHVTEFGAVCTVCHSAEVHKKVTASEATCTGCHHNPSNERCEGCHRQQAAFYRGQLKTSLVKVEPNVMVNSVGCTGCHDLSRKHSRDAVAEKCVGCHDAGYKDFARQWTIDLDRSVAKAADAVRKAELALNGRRTARSHAESRALLKDAREAVTLVRRARGVHNPAVADSLLEKAELKAREATSRAR